MKLIGLLLLTTVVQACTLDGIKPYNAAQISWNFGPVPGGLYVINYEPDCVQPFIVNVAGQPQAITSITTTQITFELGTEFVANTTYYLTLTANGAQPSNSLLVQTKSADPGIYGCTSQFPIIEVLPYYHTAFPCGPQLIKVGNYIILYGNAFAIYPNSVVTATASMGTINGPVQLPVLYAGLTYPGSTEWQVNLYIPPAAEIAGNSYNDIILVINGQVLPPLYFWLSR